MRVIIRCTRCQRQFDAGEHAAGSVVHCHCGETITVKQPRGHDASVVRCSGCGAPREEHAANCGHGGGDFTIHERDLNTVCPQCLARISDRARYCHHCATPITPESLGPGKTTDLRCPACLNKRLNSRRLGREQASVAECERCGGLWIGKSVFASIRERIARQSQHLVNSVMAPPKRASVVSRQKGPLYRKCASCDKILSRRQYARGSGIIIDICREHGIWFDAGELESTVRFIAAGGRTKRPLTEKSKPEPVSTKPTPPSTKPTPPAAGPAVTPLPDSSDTSGVPAQQGPSEDPLTILLSDFANHLNELFEDGKLTPRRIALIAAVGLGAMLLFNLLVVSCSG